MTGKERFMGIGPIRDVGLAEAREAAGTARALVRSNTDPIEHRIGERAKAKAKAKAEATGTVAFAAYAKQHIAGKEAGWKNEKHRQHRQIACATNRCQEKADAPMKIETPQPPARPNRTASLCARP
ncbi:Arm DNA-binding domain-containing protein [Bradyrhizobium sp. 18BD]